MPTHADTRRPATSRRRLRAAGLGLCALLPSAGCAAGQYYDAARELQTKNPHLALEYIGLCLQEDPEHAEARTLLSQKVLKTIASQHEANVEAMSEAGTYAEAVADCDRVVAANHHVRSFPGNYQIYHEEHRSELAQEAAAKFYGLGEERRDGGEWKNAAKAYRRALGFRLDYKDAQARYESCAEQARVYLHVRCAEDGPDGVGQDLARSLAPETKEKGLEFLEFVREPGEATSTCYVRVESGDFRDTGWQRKDDSGTEKVAKRDSQGNVIKDKDGDTVTEVVKASWSEYTRRTSYELRASFSVDAQRERDPEPSGTTTQQASDISSYATWNGDKRAVPNRILELPSSPVAPKDRDLLASECVSAAIEDLGHQLFLVYK